MSPYLRCGDPEFKPNDSNPHGSWKLMFGEMFWVAALILADYNQAEENRKNYSVLICCSGFNTNGKESLIKQVYIFFCTLFNKNDIKVGRILVDEEATAILNCLVINNYKVTLIGRRENIIKSTSDFIERGDYQRYFFKAKKELLPELLNSFSNLPDFAPQIAGTLDANTQQTLKDYVDNQIAAINPFVGQSIILVLRKRGLSNYDVGRKNYEITSKLLLARIIKSIREFNQLFKKKSQIKRIFLLGDDAGDTSFFGVRRHESPLSFLSSITNDIKFCTFSGYKTVAETICNNQYLQFLAQAYVFKYLKEQYQVRLGIGPNSGGTHALAIFGLPILFPVDEKEDNRFFVHDENLKAKSPYFPVNPDLNNLTDTFNTVFTKYYPSLVNSCQKHLFWCQHDERQFEIELSTLIRIDNY